MSDPLSTLLSIRGKRRHGLSACRAIVIDRAGLLDAATIFFGRRPLEIWLFEGRVGFSSVIRLRLVRVSERDLHEAGRKLETYVSGRANPTQPGHTLGTPSVKTLDFSGSQPAKLLN